MTYEQGEKTELFVCEQLTSLGVSFDIYDEWYDLNVWFYKTKPAHRIEVKSTHLVNKHTVTKKAQRISMCAGQFHFVDDHNRETQHSENVWYAFVLCHHEQMMLLGFIRAQEVPNKKYLNWAIVARKKLLSVKEFVEVIK